MNVTAMVCRDCNKPLAWEKLASGEWLCQMPCACGCSMFILLELPEEMTKATS